MYLETYIEPLHFNNLGLLLLTFCLLWAYFTFAEYITVWYNKESFETAVLAGRLYGPMAPYFWTMVVCCLILPLAFLIPKRTPLRCGLASLFVVVGMWLERYVIVVGTLSRPRMSFMWHFYRPTWVELSIMAGAVAYFVFLYLVFAKLFPIVSIWEYKEGLRQ